MCNAGITKGDTHCECKHYEADWYRMVLGREQNENIELCYLISPMLTSYVKSGV